MRDIKKEQKKRNIFMHVFMILLFSYLFILSNLTHAQSQEKEYILGEQTPNGRNYPRLLPPDWKAYLDVGPSINFRTSTTLSATTAQVDVVIQTFTTPSCQCTTSLGRVGEGFPFSMQTSRNNSAELEIENTMGSVLRHRAIFRGLIPGEYYHYKVRCTYSAFPNRVFGNTESVFRATPLPYDKKDTQIVLFSDRIYAATPDQYLSTEWLNQCESDYKMLLLLEYLKSQRRLDLVLMPGDIIQEGRYSTGSPDGSHFAYLTRFHSMFESIEAGIPILSVPGNHDVIDWAAIGCSDSKVAKYFHMMATPWSRNETFKNQWWSIDWGNTHINGVDLIFDQGQENFRRNARDCNLSLFSPGSEQRNWFRSNLQGVAGEMKWRLVLQHGMPKHYDGDQTNNNWDPTGPCGSPEGTGEYGNYCNDMNAYNVDLVFGGHTSQGLRRFLADGAQGENMLYGFRTSGGYFTHLRLRSDTIVISIIVPEDGNLSRLIECFKYIPGVKSGCDDSMCTYRDYRIERIIDPSCATTATNLMVAEDLKPAGWDSEHHANTFLVPCCIAADPANPDRCINANGVSVPRIVTVRIQECDREKIQPGCLRRQILPIVINPRNGGALHVTNPELLRECTPCGRKAVNGVLQINGYELSCGKKQLHRGPSPWMPQAFTFRIGTVDKGGIE